MLHFPAVVPLHLPPNKTAKPLNMPGDPNHEAHLTRSSRQHSLSSKTLLGMGGSSARSAANDPFDYELKYPPDVLYKELDPSGRVWKASLDEVRKVDADLLTGWRDSLDVLLVFAALFSAVVTTFVAQTCQSMQISDTLILTSMVGEMIQIQRVFHLGQKTIETVPVAQFSFEPKTSDVWVNALWFTSLGLSLSAAVFAVLTKQWIHEYASLPSGTSHLILSRFRHFRFKALQKWNVPLVIELLPLLMHASLSLFFLGLVIYFSNLNRPIVVQFGLIASLCFYVYAVSNIIPIFYPDCPYKTPLSSHFFSFFWSLHRGMRSFGILLYKKPTRSRRTSTDPESSSSLYEAEMKHVKRFADQIDVSNLAWMYNTTHNSSMQSLVIQALSSVPLDWIAMITQPTPNGIPDVLEAIETHYRTGSDVAQFERFQRAALRFRDPDLNREGKGVFLHKCKGPSPYTLYRDPVSAIELVKRNLLCYRPNSGNTFDIILWGSIFTTAIRTGTKWLEISETEPSRYWSELLRFAAGRHECTDFCHDDHDTVAPRPMYSFPKHYGPRLCIVKYKTPQTATTSSVGAALSRHMFPSFINWLLDVGFPKTPRSSTIPNDIVLQLAMVGTPSIQQTSSLHETWLRDNKALARQSLFRDLLDNLTAYAVGSAAGYPHSDDVQTATISTLQDVMKTEAFGRNTIIVEADEATIVRVTFKGLNKHLRKESRPHNFSWLTPEIVDKIVNIAFAAHNAEAILSNVLSYVLCSSKNLDALERLYRALVDRDWLQSLRPVVHILPASGSDVPRVRRNTWKTRHSSFLASAYIDGLPALAEHSPATYRAVIDNLGEPENLATICKLLLSADTETQKRLWKLAKIVQVDHWSSCLTDLVQFAASDDGARVYGEAMAYPAVGIGGVDPKYLRPGEIVQVAATFADDVERGSYAPPQFVPAIIVNNDLVQQTVGQGTHRTAENIIINAYHAQE